MAKSVITYGSGSWATGYEARTTSLLAPDGMLLDKFGRDSVCHDEAYHVLCFVPTRLGKGVGHRARHQGLHLDRRVSVAVRPDVAVRSH